MITIVEYITTEKKLITVHKLKKDEILAELRNSMNKFSNNIYFDYEIEAILNDLRKKNISLVKWSDKVSKNAIKSLTDSKNDSKNLFS